MNIPDTKLPDLLFVDVETTGLDPKENVIIELAACRVPMSIEKWPTIPDIRVWRFKPTEKQAALGAEAFKVNGWHKEHPDWVNAPTVGSPEAHVQWKKFAQFARYGVLCSSNVYFDRGFLETALLDAGIRVWDEKRKVWMDPWARRIIELQSFSAQIALQYKLDVWGLHEAYAALGAHAALGAPALQEHRAVADVKRGMAVFEYAMTRFFT